MESRGTRLPGAQSGAPLFNLLDECVECLLSFRQIRLVVLGGNADGLGGRPSHDKEFPLIDAQSAGRALLAEVSVESLDRRTSAHRVMNCGLRLQGVLGVVHKAISFQAQVASSSPA